MTADTYSPGTTSYAAAEKTLAVANRTGVMVEASFNGTPMRAVPGETAENVERRWSAARSFRQAQRQPYDDDAYCDCHYCDTPYTPGRHALPEERK